MTRTYKIGLVAMLAAFSFAGTASADNYSVMHCENAAGDTCSFHYRILPASNREFRMDCTTTTEAIPAYVEITDRARSVTCGAPSNQTDYTSQTCTNRDPIKLGDVTVKITCRDKSD